MTIEEDVQITHRFVIPKSLKNHLNKSNTIPVHYVKN